MRKLLCAMIMSVMGCAAPLAQPANDWQAITVYPPAGVYRADFLPAMVAAVEGLWELQTAQNQPLLKTIDSIASMNVIVAQSDEVRFRRIIELQELDEDGLQRMQHLVDVHPLVQRRLVTADGQATHIWLQLQPPADPVALARITSRLQHNLQQSLSLSCRIQPAAQGPLAGRYLTQWQFNRTEPTTGLQALQALAQAQQRLTQTATDEQSRHYSALDLLNYLGRILGPELISREGLPVSDMAVSQMYMLAESLRSRDLQALARPDFRQLQLVMLGHRQAVKAPTVAGYQLSHIHEWLGNNEHYQVLDCRSPVTASAEE